jgi:hypothetical protein
MARLREFHELRRAEVGGRRWPAAAHGHVGESEG